MNRIKIGFLGLIILASLAAGCASMRKSSPKELVCPPPPRQNCRPGEWNGVPIDTSTEYKKKADFYYILEPVKQANTPDDEWCLSFLSPRKAALTFSDAGQQRTMLVRMVTENKVELEGGIGIPAEGSAGALSVREGKAAYASALPSPPDIPGNSNVYYGEIKGNMIENVLPLGDSVKTDYRDWESQPALSPDGKVIFFASDRPNGMGGTDLWFTVRQSDGNWSSPINCGYDINSKCDELTPFVSADGKTLLFASSGHETVGGYDLFAADIHESFWQAVKYGNISALKNAEAHFSPAKNMGAPLNTQWDELFPSSPADYRDLLYYSSNQSNQGASYISLKGGFDIYVMRKVTPARLAAEKRVKTKAEELSVNPERENQVNVPENIPLPTYTLMGTVFNASTNMPIPRADIVVRELNPAYVSKKDTSKTSTGSERELEIVSQGKDLFFDSLKLNADSVGNYSVKLDKDKGYEVSAQVKDLFFDSYKIRVEKEDTVKVVHRDLHVPVQFTLRINFPTDKYNDPYKYVLDSAGVESNETWQEELDLLAHNLIISKDKLEKIILVGHTDDVADEQYNQKLGQNRVNFIIDQLVNRGVPRELLEGRSAGELEPLPRRKGEDLQMFRKRLRRVELLKELKKY